MRSIERELNLIRVYSLGNSMIPNEFQLAIHKGREAGFNHFELDFSQVKAVFPNAANPISGIIQYYQNQGVQFSRRDSNGIIEKINMLSPKRVPIQGGAESFLPLNQIWQYETPEEMYVLVDAIILELSKLDVFEEGILNSLSWSLNEVTGNVLDHSGENCGFLMGQIHKNSKRVAFSVFDYGMGLFNSLRYSSHKPADTKESILMAISEGVTRDPKIGAGNGLYGMHEIVRLNQGSLSISTGNIWYHFEDDKTSFKEGQIYLSSENQCLALDFQLNYTKKTTLSDIFKFGGTAYKFVNLRIENLENDRGEVEYVVLNHKAGFGSRRSGSMIRNDVINIQRESGQTVILDFTGISLISSSFADEFLGKLMVEYGIFNFNNVFRIKGMSEMNQAIMQRSVSQRLASSLGEN